MSDMELIKENNSEGDGNITAQLIERITELELAMEDADYVRLAVNGDREFSRGGLAKIVKLARLMYLKNPLINRAVSVQQFYVWAQGVSFVARNKRIRKVIQAFISDPKNEVEITGHQARMDKEADLQVEGNLFFAFFTNVSSGKVRVKTLPFDEMEDIYCNPDDGREPWFYLRRWTNNTTNDSGDYQENARWYPDINYTPRSRPSTFNGIAVAWESPVLHVKVGGMSCMKFGVSEMFAALDWSLAYKSFLEDWATITRAHARFAWNLTTTGGKQGVAAAKAKLQSSLGINSGQGTERNPPPAAGSVFISGEGQKLDPVKTAGATGSSSDGRRLLLMVAAATGWPECYAADTEVLTDRGFMLHQDWQPGIKVACFNPESKQVEFHEPNALRRFEYEGRMFHFKSKSLDILVTPNHRMLVSRTEDPGKPVYEIMVADDVFLSINDEIWSFVGASYGEDRNVNIEAQPQIFTIDFIHPVDYSGEVFCFSVPYGIYVTRRNGKLAVQGNTFFGDAAIGNLATARSLDRPTELRIKNRQTLWTSVFKRMFDYVVEQAIRASSGKLRGLAQVLRDEDDEIYIEWGDDPENKKPIDPVVNVEFPSILERDIGVTVGSIVSSATLGGKPLSGMISAENTSRMLQVALGIDNVDEAVNDAMREYKAITAANLALAAKQTEPAPQPAPQKPESEDGEDPEDEPEDEELGDNSMDSVEAAIREATEAVRQALST